MEDNMKIVHFHDYCPKCEHFYEDATEYPCNECLYTPGIENSHKPINFKLAVNGAPIKPYDPKYYKRLKDYTYDITYNHLDYQKAKNWYEHVPNATAGACSVVRNGNIIGRQFDWQYDYNAEFVCRTPANEGRHKVTGVAGNVKGLTDQIARHGVLAGGVYDILPFQLTDGMNDMGVFVEMNVVPADYGNNVSKPKIAKKDRVCGTMLVRYILDNFPSAKLAVEYIRDYVEVYFQDKLHEMGYEIHYFVADLFNTYCLEFVHNKAIIMDISYRPFMTNFHLYGVLYNSDGSVLTPATQHEGYNAHDTNKITLFGSGLERYNYINATRHCATNVNTMRLLLNGLTYTKAYPTSESPANPTWNTEFVGHYKDVDLTVMSTPAEFQPIAAKAGQYYQSRVRGDGNTWQTTHSIIYDLWNKKMYLITQEDGNEIVIDF